MPWHSQSKNLPLSSYLAVSKASSTPAYLSLLPEVLLIRGKDTSSSDITSNISVALWQLFWYKIRSSNNYCCHLLLHCKGVACFPSQGFWDHASLEQTQEKKKLPSVFSKPWQGMSCCPIITLLFPRRAHKGPNPCSYLFLMNYTVSVAGILHPFYCMAVHPHGGDWGYASNRNLRTTRTWRTNVFIGC